MAKQVNMNVVRIIGLSLLMAVGVQEALCQSNDVRVSLVPGILPAKGGGISLSIEVENLSDKMVRIHLPVKLSVKVCPSLASGTCPQSLTDAVKVAPPLGIQTGTAMTISLAPKQKWVYDVGFPGHYDLSAIGRYLITATEALPDGSGEASSNTVILVRKTPEKLEISQDHND